VPEPGNPQALNRYSYVLNNPLRYNDPSGHCWGAFSFVRQLPGYSTTCNNLDMAVTILKSDQASLSQKAAAGAYVAAESGAHLMLAAGAAMLAGEGAAALLSGTSAAGAGATAEAAATAACADGDCTNEVQEVTQAISWVNQSVPQGARLIARWGPATGEGPLGEEIASTFRGGSYSELILTEDTTFYRVYGGSAQEISSWWSRLQPRGALQSQIDLALLPEWGNTAEEVATILVPKGTIIYEGFAAPQAGLIGGGSQVFIPIVNPAWLIK